MDPIAYEKEKLEERVAKAREKARKIREKMEKESFVANYAERTAKPIEAKPIEAKPIEAKPKKAKPIEAKPKKAPKIVYVEESSSEEEDIVYVRKPRRALAEHAEHAAQPSQDEIVRERVETQRSEAERQAKIALIRRINPYYMR